MEMLGKHQLVSGHVNASLRSRGQLLQKPTSPWRVKCCAYQQVLLRDESCSLA